MKRLLVIACIVALSGCESDPGPTGPQGPAGEQGEQGPAGTCVGVRVVYESDDKVPDTGDDPFCIDVPEIDLDDMPLVMVWLRSAPTDWRPCPGYQGKEFFTRFFEVWDGRICLHACTGNYYKIVVVK